MIKLNAYLNFAGSTEEAFKFYNAVFGGELHIMRFKDMGDFPGKDKLSDNELNKVMHAAIGIGENTLMATDLLEGFGQQLKTGNNITLSLHPASKEEADKLYQLLSEGGKAHQPMADTFWGYWGMLTDKFNINWMVNTDK